MSIKIEAPYHATADIIFVPNPDFSDEEGFDANTVVRKAMDNTLYSYNRRPDLITKTLSFGWTNFGRGKMLELIELLERHAGDFIKLTDHKDTPRVWKVILDSNQTQFTIAGRSFPCGGAPSGRDERSNFGLRFTGEIVG